MNQDERKGLVDGMLALATLARSMPLGALYEAIEREEKDARTRDGRWVQSLIQAMRWVSDVGAELARVHAESLPIRYELAVAQKCAAHEPSFYRGEEGSHEHQCQKLLYLDGSDHLGEHVCHECGHPWVSTKAAEVVAPAPTPARSDIPDDWFVPGAN